MGFSSGISSFPAIYNQSCTINLCVRNKVIYIYILCIGIGIDIAESIQSCIGIHIGILPLYFEEKK